MSRKGFFRMRPALIRHFFLLVPVVSCLLFGRPTHLCGQTTVDTNSGLKAAVFDLDVTPPLGSMMAYDPVVRRDAMTLRCRGVVLSGIDATIVLCAVDWIGIANESYDLFRKRIAEAAGTTADRVALHCLHQHDAPRSDFSAEQILNHMGAPDLGPFAGGHQREVLKQIGNVISGALEQSRPVTHYGFGVADVEQVASNRRLLDENGKVWATRYTTCRDAKMRALPDGTIDPQLSCLVLYQESQPIVSMTYYACHPQSYYRTGVPSPDFPGLARFIRGQDQPDVMHIHFNGAGGNIGAGKYNDGNKANRLILARRVADAMQRALQAAEPQPLAKNELTWTSTAVSLPPAPHLNEATLNGILTDPAAGLKTYQAAADLAWLRRCQAGDTIQLSCLGVGETRVLHLPGELFVEFQLAAKAMRKDLNIAMAAYGDYGTGYIGTEIAYGQGGYETSERASRVGKESEQILMAAIDKLLQD